MKSLGTAAYHALPEKGRHAVDKIHGKYLKMTKFDIIFTIIMVIIIVLIIILLVFTFDSSITKKNITVTDNLTVNGTLTAKSTSTETTFNNITCDEIICDEITVGAFSMVVTTPTTSADTLADPSSYDTITISTGDAGDLSILGAIYCGSSNYGNANLSDFGLYFCSNLGYSNELDIVAINSTPATSTTSTTSGVILNIYVSDTHIAGLGGQTTSAPYIDPLVSMTTNTVTINGEIAATGTISCLGITLVNPNDEDENVVLACSGSSVLNVNGTVESNGAALTSDYRLKEEIQPISDSFSIDKLKPCSYLLKDDESKKIQTGFIAHELQEIFPHLVNGEKDGEEMQSVNYIGLIAILTKELQSLKSDNIELKADINMLKAKLC
jgi:hypothetical protein